MSLLVLTKAASELRKLADLRTNLQPHQQRVVDRMRNQPGLVVAHGLGSGKSLTSIAVADELGMDSDIVVPASLRANYSKEIKKHVKGDFAGRIHSMQGLARKKTTPAGKGLLVVDEAHRMRNPNTGTTQTMKGSKHQKRLAMTGTPVYNSPFDIVPLVNFAAGKDVLPASEEAFNKKYIHERQVSPGIIGRMMGLKPGVVKELRNKDELRKVLQQWVDFQESGSEHFPSRSDEVHTVTMSGEQDNLYRSLMGKAPAAMRLKVKLGLPPSKKELQNLNSFLSAVRQVSTAVEPFVHSNAKPTPKLLTAVGKLTEAHKKNPKQRSIVYSNYLEGGLKPYAQLLDKAKIPYGIYTGEQPRKYRDELVEKYNRGELPVLLLSSAGGEGLDLKGTRLVQVLEPHWNDEKIEQAVGRAIRYKSHSDLPHEERNVTVQKFMSLPRQGFFGRLFGLKRDKGTDEYLTSLATGKSTLNDQVMDLLKQKDAPQIDATYQKKVRKEKIQHKFTDMRKTIGLSHAELKKLDQTLSGMPAA